MKPLTPIACALVLVGCGASEGPDAPGEIASEAPRGWSITPQGDMNQFFDCLADEGMTVVSAHRGGPYPRYPENALESFENLLETTPALLEVDVAASADGVLYLMHDDTLDRVTNGEGSVKSRNWAEVKTLRLKDDDGRLTSFHPTRFDEALAFAKDRTILKIDFKQSARFEDVVAEVERQDAKDSVVFIAYSIGAAKKLHRLAPNVMISLSLESQSEINRAVAEGIPANRLMGFTGVDNPRPRVFDALADRDIEVIFGTLGGRNSLDVAAARKGDDSLYTELSKDGVDNHRHRPPERSARQSRQSRASAERRRLRGGLGRINFPYFSMAYSGAPLVDKDRFRHMHGHQHMGQIHRLGDF